MALSNSSAVVNVFKVTVLIGALRTFMLNSVMGLTEAKRDKTTGSTGSLNFRQL
jgi:hypothetical protein